MYTAFLEELRDDGGRWSALPRDVARWWRRRGEARTLEALPGATVGCVMSDGAGETEVLP